MRAVTGNLCRSVAVNGSSEAVNAIGAINPPVYQANAFGIQGEEPRRSQGTILFNSLLVLGSANSAVALTIRAIPIEAPYPEGTGEE
jgi:hypothetical protein